MSDNQQTEPAETSPQDRVSDKWDKLRLDWARARLGHEGMMLEKIQRQNRIAELNARNAVTGDLSTDGWPRTDGEGDDMGVSIGNTVHNHYPTPQPTAQPNSQSSTEQTSTPSNWKRTAALVALSALTGGGTIGTIAGLWPQSAIEQPASPQSNVYDVEKWVPPKSE